VAGIAKARTQGEFSDTEVKSSEERFFLPGRQNPVVFQRSSKALKILVSIRDEAHRFAITYHRNLREKSSLASELDLVFGLGPAKKKALLKRFKDLSEIRDAKVEDICEVKGITEALAERILEQLRQIR
jgi:excinuclease ABC subunit C